MSTKSGSAVIRKKEHIELCLTDKVSFKEKTNGFERYDFEHYALTEVEIEKISFSTRLFGIKVNYPFLISCMTGGAEKSESINAQLAIAAEELKIPVGVGSQREILEKKSIHSSFKVIRKNAPSVPLFGNIGAAQLVKSGTVDNINFLIDSINADALVIHLNPAQELFQKEGELKFKGLLKNISSVVKKAGVPVIVKEVGSGISAKAAKAVLDCGVEGIDVAGSGGTSWTGVEMLRNKNAMDSYFWDWGLPTSYCIKSVYELKKKFDFILIGSGGINDPVSAAKAYALGADFTASARIVLQQLNSEGIDGVVDLIKKWFKVISEIMFLTGSQKLPELKNKIVLKESLF